jgi:hypothetical protein
MTMTNCTAEDFANARLNPTYRTVQNWHDKWRATHLGPRTGQGVIMVCYYHSSTKNRIFLKC